MRLFIAVDIPDDVRASVRTLVEKLRPTCKSARWVRIEGVHVTLKFIGEASPEKAGEIKSALAHVLFRIPIPMKFSGMGFFPNERRPRVLWVGIQAGPELAALTAAVESALVGLGIPRDDRAFSPHLTLARFDSPASLQNLHTAIQSAGNQEFGETLAKEFHLYQSVLKRGGAEYTRVASFSIKGSAPE